MNNKLYVIYKMFGESLFKRLHINLTKTETCVSGETLRTLTVALFCEYIHQGIKEVIVMPWKSPKLRAERQQ